MYASLGASLTQDPSSTRRAPTYSNSILRSEIIAAWQLFGAVIQQRIPHLFEAVKLTSLISICFLEIDSTIENTLTRLFNRNIISRIQQSLGRCRRNYRQFNKHLYKQ